MTERALAVVDTGAIERNCALIAGKLHGEAELCAVVKADGYGHGMVAAATAALAGGASRLAVATAAEAEGLRAGFGTTPILVMGALTEDDLRRALRAGGEIAVWHPGFRDQASRVAAELGTRAAVHVKFDSGMGRLGTTDEELALDLVESVAADEHLELTGLWTHFATADESRSKFFEQQLNRFDGLVEKVRAAHPGCLVHAANSAAVFREPASHFDMVRCGIAIYGLDPQNQSPDQLGLAPAMELRSYVADVKRFTRGMSAGYGRKWKARRDTWVGVLPIGYGDGVRRGLTNDAEVLVGGRRYPLVGTISMDNITIELGPETTVAPGTEAVLIGTQGEERILAEDLAQRLETINYEITCGISARVPRAYVG